METQRYYDDFSRRYEEARGAGYHAMVDELEAGIVGRVLAEGGGRRLLEVGCGTGLILQRLLRHTESATGVDLSRQMLAAARDRGLTVAHADALQLPFADASFDLACSFKVLAHVPRIRGAIAEIARVVRPGGSLVLEFYNPLSLRYLAKRAAGPRRTGLHVDESDVSTRWDPPWRVERYLPFDVELQALRGVRVVTPLARALEIPVMGRLLQGAEQAATRSRWAAFAGGFVVAIARKR